LEQVMSGSQDTEITLGTGKMLALFFGLVLLCAVFFGMGFRLGRNAGPISAAASELAPAVTATNGGPRPSAVKPTSDPNTSRSPDLAFYKAAQPKPANPQAASDNNNDANTAAASNPSTAGSPSDGKPAPADSALAPPSSGYYVQVAAVTKQEDAEALVDALKRKQYPAFSAAMSDKLFHVQVGPFADVKNAEEMRSKLVSDGYNPILKK
jgi:DedD protein